MELGLQGPSGNASNEIRGDAYYYVLVYELCPSMDCGLRLDI